MTRRSSFGSPTLWITLEKIAQQFLWFLLFVVLGPVLGPKPYGQFGLVMVVVGLCELVLAEPAAEALMTLEVMSRSHLGVANLCNVAAGILAAGVIVLLAGPLAAAFHDPVLASLLMALAPLPVLASATAAPTAILKRQLKFQRFAVRSIIGLVIGGALGVAAAFAGAGVWALVIQILAQRAAEAVILCGSTPESWALSWSRAAFNDLIDCARNVSLARSLTWIAGQAPRFLLAGLLGTTALGLFILASRVADVVLQVILVPATVVARVEMRQSPAAPEAQAALRRLIREVALFSFPACAGLAAITPALFSLWLGDRWIGAGAATEITVLSIAPWTFFYCASAAMMSLKLSRLEVLVQGALSATSAAAVILAAPFGLNGVCAALVLRLFVLSPLPFGLLRRYAGLTMRPLLLAPVGLAAAAAVMGVVVSLASPGIVQIVGRWAALPALIGLGVVLFGAMAFFLEPLEVRRLLALSGLKSRTAPSTPRA